MFSKTVRQLRAAHPRCARATMMLMREPLMQFLLIGALLFGLYALRGNAVLANVNGRIHMSAGEIEQLRAMFMKQRQRSPTEEELRELIDARIQEEVLYREALAMGLDKDDTIVKRRLAQKLEFLTEDLSAAGTPTDAQITAFFAEHEARYQLPSRISFVHVYFSTAKRNQRAAHDAEKELARLRAGIQSRRFDETGDMFLLDRDYRRILPEEIEKVFGRDFAEEMLKLPQGEWHGPIASGYGLHLVKIGERLTSDPLSVGAVREQVERDWIEDQRRRIKQATFKNLRDRYQVVIDDQAIRERAIARLEGSEEIAR
jgi:peptidyl-prolyl cis-trans isomerase C